MTRWGILLVTMSLLSACGSGPAPRVAPSPASGEALSVTSRVLVEGVFTLPPALVSTGAGQLVSAGSGRLVSAGSGQLVSNGAGMYRTLALAEAGVEGALVTLTRPGRGLSGVAPARTDAQGRYVLFGHAEPGVYVVSAAFGGATYSALAPVRREAAARATVDVASTLVATRLLEDGPLQVLAIAAYDEAAAVVRAALAPEDLPEGWTPEHATATLEALEGSSDTVRAALVELASDQTALEERYRLMLTQHPAAADDLAVELSEETPEAVASPSSDGSGSASASPPPAQPAEEPAESPTPTPDMADQDAPEGATPAPAPTPTALATPTPAASATPNPDAATPTPAATPLMGAAATPTPAPTPTPEPQKGKSAQPRAVGRDGVLPK